MLHSRLAMWMGALCAPLWLLSFGAAPVIADDLYAYGEYLAGECTSCHLLSGDQAGSVPVIVALDETYFKEAMLDYQAGFRENDAMGSVARALDEQMIDALARFFSQQTLPEEQH